MSPTIKEATREEIAQPRSGPVFDFVEQAAAAGKAYRLGEDGSFVVANPDSLVPRFVIKFRYADIANLDFEDRRELTWKLNETSFGFMWFDDDEEDAFALAWRMRLAIRASTPLFQWTDQATANRIAQPGNYNISIDPVAGADANRLVESVLSAHSPYEGGIPSDRVEPFVQKHSVYSIANNGQHIGAILLYDNENGFVSVSGRVDRSRHAIEVEALALEKLAAEVRSNGKQLIFGMANTDQRSFMLARLTGMKMVRRGWVAQLGQF